MFPFDFPAITENRQDRPYTKPLLIAVLLLAAVLRFSFLVELQSNPMPDMVSRNQAFDQFNYVTMAYDIMKNHWLGSQHPGHSPVYSYLIAVIYSIFGRDMNGVFIFQILFGVLAVYLFYRCAVLLFKNKDLGLLTAFVAANYSPFIYYECALLRESVIAYTNLTALYFFLLAFRKGKGKNYFLAGMASALSFILRAGPLPIVVLGYLFLRKIEWKTRWTSLALVLAGMSVVIAPLTVRNYVSGFKALTETSGPTLFWLGNSYDSPGIGLTYTKTQETLTAETQGRILKTIEVLWREIGKHPKEYRDLFVRKFKMLFNGYEIPANLSYDLFKEQSVVLKAAVFNFVLIAPLALFAMVLFFRKYENIGFLYTLILTLTAFVFIFHIQSRYRIPYVPFYVLAASYSLFWFWQMYRAKLSQPLLGAAILFPLLFLFTYPDRAVMNRYFDGGIRAIDYSNMAAAYLIRVVEHPSAGEEKTRSLEKALKYYDKALPLMPDDYKVSIYITQAMVYRDLLLRVHALDVLSKALAIDPENPIAKKEYQRLLAETL
ncbi:MAG: glycosyltransferase family 39 protein [Candidatus Omnitrophica bacterium]|nr:glycosyltransferase family 39 protein [Candidatus Omnitrophota bacterium]